MSKGLKLALASGVVALGLGSLAASAMPMNGLAPAVAARSDTAQNVENVRWYCGYYGCHWAPGYRHWWGYRPWRHRYYW